MKKKIIDFIVVALIVPIVIGFYAVETNTVISSGHTPTLRTPTMTPTMTALHLTRDADNHAQRHSISHPTPSPTVTRTALQRSSQQPSNLRADRHTMKQSASSKWEIDLPCSLRRPHSDQGRPKKKRAVRSPPSRLM
jgi:hypothetical protein